MGCLFFLTLQPSSHFTSQYSLQLQPPYIISSPILMLILFLWCPHTWNSLPWLTGCCYLCILCHLAWILYTQKKLSRHVLEATSCQGNTWAKFSESISSWVLFLQQRSYKINRKMTNFLLKSVGNYCYQFPNNLSTPGQSFYSKQIPCIISCVYYVVSWGYIGLRDFAQTCTFFLL